MARTTPEYFKSLLALIVLLVSIALIALALYIDIVYYVQSNTFYSLHVSILLFSVSELLFCLSCILWALINALFKSRSSKNFGTIYIVYMGFIILLSVVSMGAAVAIINLFIKYAKQTRGISFSDNYQYISALVPLFIVSQFLRGSLIVAEIALDYSADPDHIDPDDSYVSKGFADTQSFEHNITEISPISYRNATNNPYQQTKEKMLNFDPSFTISSNNVSRAGFQTTPKHFSAYNTTPPLTQQTSSSTISLTTSEANIENPNKNSEFVLSKSQLSPIKEPDNSFNSLDNDFQLHQGNTLNAKYLQSQKKFSLSNLREGNTNVGVKISDSTMSNNSYTQNNSTPFLNDYSQTTQKDSNHLLTAQISDTNHTSYNALNENLLKQTPGLKIIPNQRRTTLRKPSVPIPSTPLENDQKDEVSTQESESLLTDRSKNHSKNSMEFQIETKKAAISVETKWSHKQDGHDMASINTASLWPFMKSPTECRMSPTFGHFHRENIQKRVILPKVVKMDASAIESELNLARTGSIASIEDLVERQIQQKVKIMQESDCNEDLNEVLYSASVIEKPDDDTVDNMLLSDSISVFPKFESDNLSSSDRPSHDTDTLDFITSEDNATGEVNKKHESILKKIKRRSTSPLKRVKSGKYSLEKTRVENRRQILSNINTSSSMKEKLNNSPIKKRINNFPSIGHIDFDFIKQDSHSTSSDSLDYLDIIKNYNNENDNNENLISKQDSKFKGLGSKMNLDTIRSMFNQDSNKNKSEKTNESHSFIVYGHSDGNDKMNSNSRNYQTPWNWNVEDSTKNFVDGIMYDKDADLSASDSSDDDNSRSNYSKSFPFEIPSFKNNDNSNNNHDTSIGSYFNEEFSITEEYDKPHEYSDVPSNTTVSKFSHMVSNSISVVAKKVHKRGISFATENQDAEQFDDSAINAIENLRNSSDSFNFVDQTATSTSPRSISEYNKEKLEILDR